MPSPRPAKGSDDKEDEEVSTSVFQLQNQNKALAIQLFSLREEKQKSMSELDGLRKSDQMNRKLNKRIMFQYQHVLSRIGDMCTSLQAPKGPNPVIAKEDQSGLSSTMTLVGIRNFSFNKLHDFLNISIPQSKSEYSSLMNSMNVPIPSLSVDHSLSDSSSLNDESTSASTEMQVDAEVTGSSMDVENDQEHESLQQADRLISSLHSLIQKTNSVPSSLAHSLTEPSSTVELDLLRSELLWCRRRMIELASSAYVAEEKVKNMVRQSIKQVVNHEDAMENALSGKRVDECVGDISALDLINSSKITIPSQNEPNEVCSTARVHSEVNVIPGLEINHTTTMEVVKDPNTDKARVAQSKSVSTSQTTESTSGVVTTEENKESPSTSTPTSTTSTKDELPPIDTKELLEQMNDMKNQISSRDRLLKASDRELEELNSQLIDLRGQLLATQQLLKESETRCCMMAERLATNAEIYDQLVEQMKVEFSNQQKRVDETMKLVESENKQNEEKLKRSAEQLTADTSKLQNELQLAVSKKQELENRMKRRKLFSDKAEELNSVIDLMNVSIAAQNEVMSTENTDSRLKVLANEMKSIGLAFNKLKDANKSLQKLIDFGDKKNDQLSFELSDQQLTTTQLTLTNTQLTSQISEKDTQNQQLQSRVEQLVSENVLYGQRVMQLASELEGVKKQCLEAAQNSELCVRQLNDNRSTISELTESLRSKENELNSTKKLRKREKADYELKSLERLSGDAGELLQLLREEIDQYREALICSLCKCRPKDCIISRCQHIFCRNCVEDRVNRRERKCPDCLTPFGTEEVKRIWIVKNAALLKELGALEEDIE